MERRGAGVVGVLDLGSSTFHLLVARVAAGSALESLLDAKHATRLGEAVLAHGIIDDLAWEHGLHAALELIAQARACGAPLVVVGTSALREAANGRAFAEELRRRAGVAVSILSPDEEARYSFAGAISECPPAPGAVAVLDVGGGSTDVALGYGTIVTRTLTAPIGVLRAAEAWRGAGDDVAAKRGAVARLVEIARPAFAAVRAEAPARVVFAAGTARLVARLLGVTRVTHAEISGLVARLAALGPAELRRLGVPSARLGTIAPGAALLAALLEGMEVDVVVLARRALREGIALHSAACTMNAGGVHASFA